MNIRRVGAGLAPARTWPASNGLPLPTSFRGRAGSCAKQVEGDARPGMNAVGY